MKKGKVEIYKDQAKQWRGRTRSANGKILCETSESYRRRSSVVNALMKTKQILVAAQFALVLALFTGCATTPTQQHRIEVGVKAAAQIGGGIVLLEHPEWRRGFQEAVLDLGIIADAEGQVGISEVVAVVQRLDVKELRSPQAQLAIAGGLTLLDSFGRTELNPQSSAQVKAIAAALRDGLKLALVATAQP